MSVCTEPPSPETGPMCGWSGPAALSPPQSRRVVPALAEQYAALPAFGEQPAGDRAAAAP